MQYSQRLSKNLEKLYIQKSQVNLQYGFEPESEADLPGFEPGSRAPEAPMLSKLYYRSNQINVEELGRVRGLKPVDEPGILSLRLRGRRPNEDFSFLNLSS